ncbi:MAG: PaaI family thioesterase [Candidatus Competibacter sp.]|nr:PaaI family thioesterase [Candidatus Competibacter sp.]MDG4583219.1 PaaI family thioesterase [Candidatus Competibacter sp.]
MNFIPCNPEFASIVQASFEQQGLMKTIGATLDRIEPGAVDISAPHRDNLTQQQGFLHAAAITAIADSACGYAALSLMPAGSEVLTIEFKVNLLRPAAGTRFVAEGRVVKPGKTITVSRADVFAYTDEVPVLIATLLATMIAQAG